MSPSFASIRTLLTTLFLTTTTVLATNPSRAYSTPSPYTNSSKDDCITPKFFIISMFTNEAEAWYGIPDFNLLAHNISLPGLSPLFPDIHCDDAYDICQIVVGEGEINAATSMSALVFSGKFDLSKTYFMVAGIAGINPNVGTTADVTFARYAIQVALQYEIDAREIPENFTTGYFGQGSSDPTEYPQTIYGTEVFEVNDALRKMAVSFAQKATLNDSDAAAAYRANYPEGTPARDAPSVRELDVITTDVFLTGALLGDSYANYTKLITNGTGVYGTSVQEDNATLEVLVRAAFAQLLDFSRVIIMRTCSDFDRPYPGESVLQNLLFEDPGVSLFLRVVARLRG